MKSLRIDEAAEEELAAAAEWYDGQRDGLGAEFLNAVEDLLPQIQAQPERGGAVPGAESDERIRRLMMKRFPYSIVYMQLPDEIRVLAFAHARRRPGYWRNR